jgi:hypothetical protein
MALDCAVGTFDLNASTGNQSVASLSFQPTFGIFWTVGMNAAGSAAQHDGCIGLAVSSSERAYMAWRSDDAQGTIDSAAGLNTTRLLKLFSDATGPAVDVEVDFVSWDATGFTVNISNAPASTIRVHYIVWGGSDLTNVKLDSFTVTNTATQAVTGVGFEPETLFFLNARRALGDGSNANPNFGICTGVGEEAAIHFMDTDAAAAAQIKIFARSGASLLGTFAGTSVSEQLRSHVQSLDSDGFTLAHDTQSTDGERIIFVALKGAQWNVLADAQKTSTGTQSKTGMGFQPDGLFGFSAGRAASASPIRSDGIFALGLSRGSTERSTFGVSDDGNGTSDTNKGDSATKFLVLPSTTGTTSAECDVNSFDADGYTLNWTTADGTARQFFVLGWAAAAGGTPYAENPSDSVALSDAVTFELVKGVADTVTPSDAITHDRGVLLADTVGLADSLSSAKAIPLSPADSVAMSDGTTQEISKTVDVNDSVTMSDTIVFDRGLEVPDSVGLADQVVFSRANSLSDSVSLSDLANFAREMLFGDTLSLSDLSDPVLETGGGTDHTVNPEDSVSMSDNVVFAVDKVLNLDDTLPLTDSVAFDRQMALGDVLGLADAVARSYGLSQGDVVTLADLAEPFLDNTDDWVVEVDDSVTLSDALSFIREVLKADTVTPFDAVERRLNGVLLEDGDVAVIRQGIIYIGRF